MNIESERTAIYKAYSSPEWLTKVKKMSDAQVHAIYIRLKQKGRI